MQWEKDHLFNRWCWENWTATCKRMKLHHFLTSYTEINSKFIKSLNVRFETMKIIEDSTGNNFSDTGHSNIFLDRSPETRETKANINYWWRGGGWVAQSVERRTSAQVMISWLLSLSPASGSVLTAQSLEPASDFVFPSLSAPPLLMLCPSLSPSLSQK